MIISRAPVRISLFGGGTDYPDYYLRHGGAVLGTTIDQYVYVSINQLSDFFEYKIRVGYSKSELVNSVNDIVHPSVRECLKFRNMGGNLDIHIFSDLPARTGLGSSSTFTVGFLNALYALEGKMVPKERLAKDALYIEQQVLKENVGSQDQIHAAFGGINVIEFDARGFRIRPVAITEEKREALQASMMVFFTGQTRYANEILKEQVERTKAAENDHYLERMHAMVLEAERIISDESCEEMLKRVGELMHESWQLKKALSSRVTNDIIDKAYEAAMSAGAYGGKISGAGGGGFLALIVHPEKQKAVRAALKGFLEVRFGFEDEGSTIIYIKH